MFTQADRGQSVVLGAILVFGVVVLGLGIYQAFAVPAQNAEVEFKHSMALQQNLQQVRNGILSTAFRGDTVGLEIPLGTSYPTRMIALNPPPPAGELRTVNAGGMKIEHAISSHPEVNDYWSGTALSFSTSFFRYNPIYHVYTDAPATVYENTLVYNDFETSNVILTEQTIIDGRTINLIALEGSYSQSGTSSATVSLDPTSAPARTVTLTNTTGDNITLRIPTQLSRSGWAQVLKPELDSTNSNPDKFITAWSYTPGNPSSVMIELEPSVTYKVRLAKVGVGSGVTQSKSTYITTVRGDGGQISEDETRTMVLEVRDRFNNPVAGESVNLSIRDEGGVDEGTLLVNGKSGKSITNVRTDADGQIEFTYDPADVGSDLDIQIRASFKREPGRFNASWKPDRKVNADFKLTVLNSDQQRRRAFLDLSGTIVFQNASVNEIVSSCSQFNNNPCSNNVSYTFKNVKNEPIDVVGIRLQYVTSFDNTAGGQGGTASDDVRDGPNNITHFFLTHETPKTILAEETSNPYFFWDNGQMNSTIPAESVRTLYLDVDKEFEWQSHDGIAMSITLYFENGASATYTIWKFRP